MSPFSVASGEMGVVPGSSMEAKMCFRSRSGRTFLPAIWEHPFSQLPREVLASAGGGFGAPAPADAGGSRCSSTSLSTSLALALAATDVA